MALSKSHRLSLRFNRERLTKSGNSFYGKFFTLVVANTPEEEKHHSPRLAILLSKKTDTLATNRNKIKRITSGIIEKLISTIPPKDYLIIPKKQVLLESNKTLFEDLQSLFLK